MIAVAHSATLTAATGRPVLVEVHVGTGLPSFTVVGLPDASVREARDRVRAAIESSGLSWPNRRITVNLAPSGVRKGGSGLDLAIAVGILAAVGSLPVAAIDDVAFLGELGLDGSVRHVPGAIAVVDAVTTGAVVVPEPDAAEASAARPGHVAGVRTLGQLVGVLRGSAPWPTSPEAPTTGAPAAAGCSGTGHDPVDAGRSRADLADVRGQRLGRRAVEVAAAGGHHLLMVGPPGSGKTMLAQRLVDLLPPLSREEALEVSRIHSAAGDPLPPGGLVWERPFRAPHHGASAVSLIGGGTWSMRPGEISRATHGCLFLDEMGEFPATVLDALRQPLEEGIVRVSRARGTATFPARFLLVGAMNPCPCGEGGPAGACRCSPAARARYARRLSGPLLDRFDLVVPLRRPDPDELLSPEPGEATATVAERVSRARRRAHRRQVSCNADLSSGSLDALAPLTSDAVRLLDRHVRAGALTGRGVDRVRRVARTIADLGGGDGGGGAGDGGDGDGVEERHVAEALALRAGRDVLEIGGPG